MNKLFLRLNVDAISSPKKARLTIKGGAVVDPDSGKKRIQLPRLCRISQSVVSCIKKIVGYIRVVVNLQFCCCWNILMLLSSNWWKSFFSELSKGILASGLEISIYCPVFVSGCSQCNLFYILSTLVLDFFCRNGGLLSRVSKRRRYIQCSPWHG